MATARQIINGALRKIGVLAAGREARPSDAQDALDALSGLYSWLVASGAFGRLTDVIPLTDYTARGNERIFRNSSQTLQITLPETLPDQLNISDDPWGPLPSGQAANLGVRTPRDFAVVSIVDAFTSVVVTYFYDGAVKRWISGDSLTLDGEAPLSFRDPEGLKALLATRIVDQFGGDLPAQTQLMAAQMIEGLTSRFSSPRTEAVGAYF